MSFEAANLKSKKDRCGRKIDFDSIVQNVHAYEWAAILLAIVTNALGDFCKQHWLPCRYTHF